MPEIEPQFKPLPEHEKKICWRVAAARRLRGLNQTQLAAKLGITRNQLANIEAKRVSLKFGLALTVCKTLNINPPWLYNGEGPEKLTLELDDPYFLGFLAVQPSEKKFCEVWAACGEELVYFGNATQRKIEDQGKEGKNAEEVSRSYSGPLRIPIEDWHKSKKPMTGAPKNKRKSSLDIEARLTDKEPVKHKIRSLPELIKNLRELTKARGLKAEVARECQVTRQAVGQWLSGSSKPSAEAAFLLLNWVEQQERQKQKSPGSEQTPPEQKTRTMQSSYEKHNPSRS